MSERIDEIRTHYRFHKSAERLRIQIEHGLTSFCRVYITDWRPDKPAAERKKEAERARALVKDLLNTGESKDPGAELMIGLVQAARPSWLEMLRREEENEKAARAIVESLPAWQRLHVINGFSAWGLAVIVGELGDLDSYGGCRTMFYRLGLAPDEAYPTGQKRTGRMIPRNRRGRIMGIIADPFIRSQWRGARFVCREEECKKVFKPKPLNATTMICPECGTECDNLIKAHPIGPYGAVYGANKSRYLEREDFKPFHAEKLARRSMIKALIHDVHRGWHDRPFDYIDLTGQPRPDHQTAPRGPRRDVSQPDRDPGRKAA